MNALDLAQLEAASRSDLITRAEDLGIDNASVLTRVELVDEIVKRTVADPLERRLARGFLGVARDLVARVVERGLHLPDAAALIRGIQQATLTPVTPPIATVTLAEIYAGQGHRDRALAVLDEVLVNEPDHTAARQLRDKVRKLPVPERRAIPPDEPPAVVPGAIPTTMGEGLIEPVTDPRLVVLDVGDAVVSTDPDDAIPTLRPEGLPTIPHLMTSELVLIPLDEATVFAYWEVRQTVLDEMRAQGEPGALVLRIIAVTATWEGPESETREVEIERGVDDCWVRDLPSIAILRGAVGWRTAQGFEPLAVAMDVTAAERQSDPLIDDDVTGIADSSPRLRIPDAFASIDAVDRARSRVGHVRVDPSGGAASWRALAKAPREMPYRADVALSG